MNENTPDNYLDFSHCLQLDGNISMNSEDILNESLTDTPIKDDEYNIEVITGNRPIHVKKPKRTPVLQRIRRNNGGELALYLPTVAVYNHRSIWKKIKNFSTEFREMKMGVALHSEVWENKEKKAHRRKIDDLFQMDGITYISTPRPNRRGGGSAITCDDENFFIKEIKVDNPFNLEVTFASLRPKSEFSPSFNIIVCALYSPPRSRKKSKLIDHISQAYHALKIKYPSAFFLLGGDVNCLDVSQLLSISSNFKQLVTKPTRQEKILSVIITDLHKSYQEPFIIKPLKPDTEGCGKPSDHSVPVAVPYTDTSKPRRREYQLKEVQPIPESKIVALGQWITTEEFTDVREASHPTEKVAALGKIMSDKINDICPKKTIKVYSRDQEWMTEPLRKLRRSKCREYRRHGRSDRFVLLQKQFDDLKDLNTKKYMEEDIETLKKCNLSQFYRKIKVIGSRLNECDPPTISLPEFIEEGLSPAEAAERMALHIVPLVRNIPRSI